jgi:hypothetical protein
MNESGPGPSPEETGAQQWREPSNDQDQTNEQSLEQEESPETNIEHVVETEEMIQLRNAAIEAKGEEPFLEMGYFRENFLDRYLSLGQEQISAELEGDNKAQAELELATLKGLFYHDVGLHNNVEGMIKVQSFAFDRLGRPDLLLALKEKISQGRLERAQLIPEPEILPEELVEEFANRIHVVTTEGGDEIISCEYQTDDEQLFKRLIRQELLPKLNGNSAALIHGETLTENQVNILADEMLRTDFPVIAVYDQTSRRYRIRYSEGDEPSGGFYKPR